MAIFQSKGQFVLKRQSIELALQKPWIINCKCLLELGALLMHSAKTPLLFTMEVKQVAISPRVCLSNSFKIFQGHPSGLLRAKYLTFLCKKSQIPHFPMWGSKHPMMHWPSLPRVIPSHKDWLLQGIHSELPGDLQHYNCFMSSSPTCFCRSTEPGFVTL